MSFVSFFTKEFKDRVAQKGLHKYLWKLFMFPFTLMLNYKNYQKWLQLMKRLEISETALEELIPISIKEAKVSFGLQVSKGESQLSLKMNEVYIYEKDVLYMFPVYKPKTKHDFYTEIGGPLIISFSGTKHPYETIWKVPTLTKIDRVISEDNLTNIYLRDETHDNEIVLIIHKKIALAHLKKGQTLPT